MNQNNFYKICKDHNININIFNTKKTNKLFFNSVTNPQLIKYLIHDIYKDIVVYTDLKIWFHYDNLWIPSSKIGKHYFFEYLKSLAEKYDKLRKKLTDTELDSYCKNVKKIFIKLYTSSNYEKIKRDCQDLFYKPKEDFLDKLDNNIYLIAFNNGVYDLESKIFRQINIDDYITLTTEYDYNPNPPYVDQVKNVINQMLPNEKERDYLLKIFACCLSGERFDKMICLISDSKNRRYKGGCGKTTILKFLFDALGEYSNGIGGLWESIGNYIIQDGKNKKIHKRYASRVHGRRAVHYGEIFGQMCSEKRILELTDEKNLSDPCKFKMFVESNKSIGNNECVVIKFNIEFVEDEVKNQKFEVLCNRQIIKNSKEWRMSFMKILLDYWELYELEGLE